MLFPYFFLPNRWNPRLEENETKYGICKDMNSCSFIVSELSDSYLKWLESHDFLCTCTWGLAQCLLLFYSLWPKELFSGGQD